MRKTKLLLLAVVMSTVMMGQNQFEVNGNGLFKSEASTNVDIVNIDDNTNSLIRFGDSSLIKSSIGFNGNVDVFKISMGNTLGKNNFTISESGNVGVNSLPSSHRFVIKHNSTSGESGSSHLTLQENGSTDFARLRFENFDENGFWTLASRATDGSARMNFFYNDGVNFANIVSLDGDLFRVGIHESDPQAFLHIKQLTAGVDALKLVNDDSTGGETWGMRIGDNDILVYFEGALRGSFNSDDGVYTNFPPPSLKDRTTKVSDNILSKVLQLTPVTYNKKGSQSSSMRLLPQQVQIIDKSWVSYSEDYQKVGIDYQTISVLSLKAIQEQQEIIDTQKEEINQLKELIKALELRINKIEHQFKNN